MENIYISLIGCLILLDTTIFFQSSVSQPLIISTLLGFYFGDLSLGLLMGIYLQLLWLSSLPVGAAVVPEGNAAAIVTAVMIFRYHENMQILNSVMVLAILYGLLLSYIGGQLIVYYRKYNVHILNRLIAQLHNGQFAALPAAIVRSLALHTLLMFIFLSCGLYGGDFLFQRIGGLPFILEKYADYGLVGVLAAGTGLLLHLYKTPASRLLIIFGVIVGLMIPAFRTI